MNLGIAGNKKKEIGKINKPVIEIQRALGKLRLSASGKIAKELMPAIDSPVRRATSNGID